MVGKGQNLITRRMVFVHNVGSSKTVASIVGLGGMCMEVALELVDSSPINICVWVIINSRSDSLSIHHFDIYRTMRLSGCAVKFDIQIETINATFWRCNRIKLFAVATLAEGDRRRLVIMIHAEMDIIAILVGNLNGHLHRCTWMYDSRFYLEVF